MKLYRKDFYNFIVEFGYIINHPIYKLLKEESHHGDNRYDHSIRVGINVYKFCRYYDIPYHNITVAALLHDFFFNKDLGDVTVKQELTEHPKISVLNARKYFRVNNEICEMIRTHMYPVTLDRPTTKEGLILSSIDKMVSTKEFCKYRVTPIGKLNLGQIDLDIDKDRYNEKEIFNLLNVFNIKINYKNFDSMDYLVMR